MIVIEIKSTSYLEEDDTKKSRKIRFLVKIIVVLTSTSLNISFCMYIE